MQRDKFEFGVVDALWTITKDIVKIKSVSELDGSEKKVYKRTGSLVYATLSCFDYADVNITDCGSEDSYRILDAAIKLLIEGKVMFEVLDVRHDHVSLFMKGVQSKVLPLPSEKGKIANYEAIESMILALQEGLLKSS